MPRVDQRSPSALPSDFFGPEPRQFRASVAAIAELGALDASLEEIPEAEPCYGCGGPTLKTIVDYSYAYECNDITTITATKSLPGYRCQECGEIYLDPALDDRFLGTIAQALAGVVSHRLQHELDRRDDHPHSLTVFTPLPFSFNK